eukprot:1472205-Prymnesium_polylepis.1
MRKAALTPQRDQDGRVRRGWGKARVSVRTVGRGARSPGVAMLLLQLGALGSAPSPARKVVNVRARGAHGRWAIECPIAVRSQWCMWTPRATARSAPGVGLIQ